MSVGENIKRIRIARGFTQEKLADCVDVNRSMIAQVERGSKIPTITLAVQIAKALNCNISELI